MQLTIAERITPRITAVSSIKDYQRNIVGWRSRCDCGSKEDHMFAIDGTVRAHSAATNHALNHRCRRSVPWAGHLAPK